MARAGIGSDPRTPVRTLLPPMPYTLAVTPGAAPAGAQTQPPAGAAPGASPEASPDAPATPPHKRRGHGRLGAAAYAGATVVECAHQDLQSGQLCPQCEKGKVYAQDPC